jgi:hypothetical protein
MNELVEIRGIPPLPEKQNAARAGIQPTASAPALVA